jgi:hypothetical protein
MAIPQNDFQANQVIVISRSLNGQTVHRILHPPPANVTIRLQTMLFHM